MNVHITNDQNRDPMNFGEKFNPMLIPVKLFAPRGGTINDQRRDFITHFKPGTNVPNVLVAPGVMTRNHLRFMVELDGETGMSRGGHGVYGIQVSNTKFDKGVFYEFNFGGGVRRRAEFGNGDDTGITA